MRNSANALIIISLAFGASAAACADDPSDRTHVLQVAFEDAPASAAGRTALANVTVRASWGDAGAAAHLSFDLVATGGGTVTPARVTTDAQGVAQFSWTLGALPIANVLTADAGDLGEGALTVVVDPAAPLQSAPFGDVAGFITARGSAGSTEDLALSPDGLLVMAHGGTNPGLFTISSDGGVAALPTSGETFTNPLGLAFDQGGALFVADGGAKAVMKVVAGVVTKLQDRDGVESFLSPNDVAVGPDGTVYLSDTCTGKVYALSPTTGEVLGRIALDPATEGGPNGLVVGRDGALWLTTENTAIFCGHDSVALTAPVAGLFRVPLGGQVFGAKETIAAGVGVFGDGLAFDADDNLYVIFDTVVGFTLDESIVYVRRAAGGPLVKAFAAQGKVYANLAFGDDAFGRTTMYLALLQIALVPNSPRGLERVDVGVLGASLPPR